MARELGVKVIDYEVLIDEFLLKLSLFDGGNEIGYSIEANSVGNEREMYTKQTIMEFIFVDVIPFLKFCIGIASATYKLSYFVYLIFF
jgi:hypothetical protein